MIFSNLLLIEVIIFVLGLCGFMVARHIRKHKIKNIPLVCPMNFDCHTVVYSDYSKFICIPVEFLGMIYYALISVAYFIFIFWEKILPVSVTLFIMTTSFIAFLFSLYLIAVQIFILKKGCSWCIVSALISACIFILTIFAYDFGSFAHIFTN